MPRTVHVIGAGLAGLSAAVALATRGDPVIVHEATSNVGGRCRSYFDHASGMTIDNGNHLILSGNRAALSFLRTIGAVDRMRWRDSASFPFADVATGERWEIDFGAGRLPWWLFNSTRRVPNTNVLDYLALARLVWCQRDRPIGTVIKCSGAIYDRLLRPLLTSALNVDPPEGSALLAATLLRETIVAGGQACRPLIARTGLSHAFIDPALAFLEQHGSEVRTNDEVRALELASDRVDGLTIGGATVALGPDDIVISAVPPASATTLLPELTVPTEYRAIFNLHFRRPPPGGAPDILGITGGLTEWIFCYPERISVTISAADALMNEPREPIAQRVWDEICVALRLKEPLPAWQIVRERRATFAAIPPQQALRPGPRTRWRNLFLAGDWTATGLPATIEGAIRSGQRAAALAVEAAP